MERRSGIRSEVDRRDWRRRRGGTKIKASQREERRMLSVRPVVAAAQARPPTAGETLRSGERVPACARRIFVKEEQP